MPTAATPSPEEMLRLVERLEPSELDAFTRGVLTVRARRKAPALSGREAELLTAVGETLPPSDLARYRVLCERREAGTLTAEELSDLLRLSDAVEEQNARRWAAVAELARLRGKSLHEAAGELGLPLRGDGG